MKKLFLIMLGPETDKKLIIPRVREIGDNYVFWERHILVFSDFDQPSELYDRLIGEEDNMQMIIFAMNENPKYWGYANKGLWEWLKKNSNHNEI